MKPTNCNVALTLQVGLPVRKITFNILHDRPGLHSCLSERLKDILGGWAVISLGRKKQGFVDWDEEFELRYRKENRKLEDNKTQETLARLHKRVR